MKKQILVCIASICCMIIDSLASEHGNPKRALEGGESSPSAKKQALASGSATPAIPARHSALFGTATSLRDLPRPAEHPLPKALIVPTVPRRPGEAFREYYPSHPVLAAKPVDQVMAASSSTAVPFQLPPYPTPEAKPFKITMDTKAEFVPSEFIRALLTKIDQAPPHAEIYLNLAGLGLGIHENFVTDCMREVVTFAAARNRTIHAINLADNGIAEFHADVFAPLTTLRVLNLANNRINLMSSPGAISEGLRNLMDLNLSANGLVSLPPGIFAKLHKLQNLDLSKNNLATINVGYFDGLTALTRLYLDGNWIETIDARAFEPLTNLYKLSLAENLLRRIPAGLLNSIPRLQSLDLSSSGYLETMQAGSLDALASLRHLNLADCGLNTIPINLIRNLHKLSRLNLSDNTINNIGPDVYNQLPVSLKELSLTGNPTLRNIPEEMLTRLEKLSILNVAGTGIAESVVAAWQARFDEIQFFW